MLRTPTPLEVDLLLEAVRRLSGCDFSAHSRAMLLERIEAFCGDSDVTTMPQLIDRILVDDGERHALIVALTRAPGPLFRDVPFFEAVRDRVIPLLRTYPSIRVWNPGCGNGADAVTLAALLAEANLLARCRIYATDLNQRSVDAAGRGVFDDVFRLEAQGLLARYPGYFVRQGRRIRARPELRRNILFAVHSLSTDADFNDFHFILCRNTLPAYAPPVQARAFRLFHRSLVSLGFLALGRGETLGRHPHRHVYEPLDEDARIYRRLS